MDSIDSAGSGFKIYIARKRGGMGFQCSRKGAAAKAVFIFLACRWTLWPRIQPPTPSHMVSQGLSEFTVATTK